MKHLEPLSKLEHDSRLLKSKSKPTSTIKIIAVAMLLTLGLGSGGSALWSRFHGDHVSEENKREIVAKFSATRSIALKTIPISEIERALLSMKLDAQQKDLLAKQLAQNSVASAVQAQELPIKLAWVELWDFASEDGDIVKISSAGYSVDVPIAKAPQRFAVPVDGSLMLTIVGIRDGGGGITLGIHSDAEPLLLPVLSVGQSLNIPIAF